MEHRVVEDTPEKLIGDKAYDSDPLDRGIEEIFGTEMIAPNRRGRKKSNKSIAVAMRLQREKTWSNG
jgi:hypothetical protein